MQTAESVAFQEKLTREARTAICELLEVSGVKAGELVVVGCSSSEAVGGRIGKNSSFDAAKAILEGIYPPLREKGIFLAAQCCEHLNRALIVERACAERFGYEIVSVVPKPKAGGSFASAAWAAFSDPVAVETVSASAGLDIGGTLIGMHLRRVAVPVRLSRASVGEAILLAARTRPKYVGGPRAEYE